MSDEPRDVFQAMERKDSALASFLATVPVWEVVDRWRGKYPEDFPKGDMTEVNDLRAIRRV